MVASHDSSHPRIVYDHARTEKEARGVAYARTKRVLKRDSIVILDGMNYIKGWRYQLWCEAKAAQTTCCVVRDRNILNESRHPMADKSANYRFTSGHPSTSASPTMTPDCVETPPRKKTPIHRMRRPPNPKIPPHPTQRPPRTTRKPTHPNSSTTSFSATRNQARTAAGISRSSQSLGRTPSPRYQTSSKP